MAGRAQLKALTVELDRRTTEAFDGWQQTDSDEPTHLDYVCLRIEDGTTTKELAEELGTALGFEFSYSRMMRYLTKLFGEAAEQQVDAARARASHWLVDEAKGIVDGANPLTVQVASARARQRNWMAERYNPSRFGQTKQTNVAISIAGLHLDALRAVPNRVTVGVEAGETRQIRAEGTVSQAIASQALSLPSPASSS